MLNKFAASFRGSSQLGSAYMKASWNFSSQSEDSK